MTIDIHKKYLNKHKIFYFPVSAGSNSLLTISYETALLHVSALIGQRRLDLASDWTMMTSAVRRRSGEMLVDYDDSLDNGTESVWPATTRSTN